MIEYILSLLLLLVELLAMEPEVHDFIMLTGDTNYLPAHWDCWRSYQ
ncbi:hypothetical protein [Vibrio phage VEN]|uniref:Uncharacterized protein n=1 Tax=Vibrio phage VEN TaxID=2059879 RepID=A0A2H5BMZ4_9CAUD|nr:hypothetical protein HOS56_gp19 [Vibrio phage VEN]AUG87699.1 hypothetical protein [Vibrio phage VEN]